MVCVTGCGKGSPAHSHHYNTDGKKYVVLNNEPAKNVYINSSEDIIKSQIQFYMKCEKQFLLFKDVINKLKNFFNII